MDSDFKYVCLPCAESKHANIMFIDGHYRKYAKCGCGAYGPVNYEEDRYFCGKDPGCCP